MISDEELLPVLSVRLQRLQNHHVGMRARAQGRHRGGPAMTRTRDVRERVGEEEGAMKFYDFVIGSINHLLFHLLTTKSYLLF